MDNGHPRWVASVLDGSGCPLWTAKSGVLPVRQRFTEESSEPVNQDVGMLLASTCHSRRRDTQRQTVHCISAGVQADSPVDGQSVPASRFSPIRILPRLQEMLEALHPEIGMFSKRPASSCGRYRQPTLSKASRSAGCMSWLWRPKKQMKRRAPRPEHAEPMCIIDSTTSIPASLYVTMLQLAEEAEEGS